MMHWSLNLNKCSHRRVGGALHSGLLLQWLSTPKMAFSCGAWKDATPRYSLRVQQVRGEEAFRRHMRVSQNIHTRFCFGRLTGGRAVPEGFNPSSVPGRRVYPNAVTATLPRADVLKNCHTECNAPPPGRCDYLSAQIGGEVLMKRK
jgi:hypothetical protein